MNELVFRTHIEASLLVAKVVLDCDSCTRRLERAYWQCLSISVVGTCAALLLVHRPCCIWLRSVDGSIPGEMKMLVVWSSSQAKLVISKLT